MDKKLRDKILDAGIVPKNAVQQMEQWQNLPQGSVDKIGKFSRSKVERLKNDLDLQSFPALRETVLDVDKLMDKARLVSLSHVGLTVQVYAGVDILNRYIFLIPETRGEYNTLSVMMRPSVILVDYSIDPPRNERQITEVSALHSTIEEGKSVPTHWFCTTEALEGEESIIKGR